jgi:hypothetical protein
VVVVPAELEGPCAINGKALVVLTLVLAHGRAPPVAPVPGCWLTSSCEPSTFCSSCCAASSQEGPCPFPFAAAALTVLLLTGDVTDGRAAAAWCALHMRGVWCAVRLHWTETAAAAVAQALPVQPGDPVAGG